MKTYFIKDNPGLNRSLMMEPKSRFHLTVKVWDRFEKIQSDIFDHLIATVSDFGLKIYQLSVQ